MNEVLEKAEYAALIVRGKASSTKERHPRCTLFFRFWKTADSVYSRVSLIVPSHLTTQLPHFELVFPSKWPVSKYHLSHVGVVTFLNMSQRIQLLAKSALALVSNVRLNGLVRWKDDNVFARVFQSTAEALCFVKRLANFLMTMSHLVFSFVPIMSQPPAPGFSALTGYGGRCTARTVSEETKKNSPIIIATNVSFMTAGGRVDVFSF